jgi:hypothetical protein
MSTTSGNQSTQNRLAVHFALTFDGVTSEGAPAKIHFQSQRTYDLYKAGRLDESYGYTLLPAEAGQKTLVFWFDTHRAKNRWEETELRKVDEPTETLP